ncbi:MAG: NUDIX domain-containing protein [Leptolyngbyaceae cyanobacterium T60_A2020_046]|nr:NUDIX domain-containing protein [Leptolyngbyaceae cyanobacterium T60_A2020_046]
MGKKRRIRPIAVCVFRHRDRILVYEGVDPTTGLRFCRPLGGGIELGEHSREAVAREIQEELGAGVTHLELLGIVESIFVYRGEQHHEIVFAYDGRFVDETLYDRESLTALEGEDAFEARWRSLAELRDGPIQLVPSELWDLL